MFILLLDNHDSFSWNLVELLRQTGKDNVKIETAESLDINVLSHYDRIIFSPGPGLPEEHPAMFRMLDAVENHQKSAGKTIPVLGICLGFQAMAVHSGGSLINLQEVVHGQPRKLKLLRTDHFLFRNIPDNCEVGLYHSWAVDPGTIPSCFEILATTGEGTIMAMAHRTLPSCGLQFHPESIMTLYGKQILMNWLK